MRNKKPKKKNHSKKIEVSPVSNKLIGLMFAKKVKAVYFEARFGLHTFFVREPIDVLILDNYYRVKVIREKLQPWSVLLWNPKYFRVLELPSGFIAKKNIIIGNRLSLVFK